MASKRLSAASARPTAAKSASAEPLETRRLFATVFVNTVADTTNAPTTGIVSLRDAIQAADGSSGNTTIRFNPQVFGSQQTIQLLSGLSLTSPNLTTIVGPVSGVIVRGDGATFVDLTVGGPTSSTDSPANISNVSFVAGGGADLALYATVTLRAVQASSAAGYGIVCAGNVTMNNVTVQNNGADGIYNLATLTLDTVTTTGNAGRGIYNAAPQSSDLTATNLIAFQNGLAGVENAQQTVADVENSSLTYNLAGGFINSGNATLINDTIANNAADTGGGIFNNGGASLTAVGDTLATNAAVGGSTVLTSGDGGGIFNLGQLTLYDSTLTGNTSARYGGGIYSDASAQAPASIINDTVVNNTAAGIGGGIINASIAAALELGNTLVAQNRITAGNGQGPDYDGRVASDGFNLIGKADGSIGFGPQDLFGTIAAPILPALRALGNFGGPTATISPSPGSPAIDAGSNAVVPASLTIDQRGYPRIHGSAVDIGAVETQPTPGATLNVTAPGGQRAAAGVAQLLQLGSFAEVGSPAPYTVSINWGDGTAVSSFIVSAPGTIPPRNHVYATAGTDTVTVTVTDNSGFLFASATFVVTVASVTYAPPAAQSVLIDTSRSVALGSFSEVNAIGPYAVDVNWGDGTADTTFTAANPGTLAASPHTYVTAVTDTVTVTVTDSGGKAAGTGTFPVVVNAGSTPSATALTASTTTSRAGSPVTLTAAVTPAAATGVVTFSQSGTTIGTANVAGGVATLTIATLPVGTGPLTATYGGNPTYAVSTSAAVPFTVVPVLDVATVSVASSVPATVANQAVTLTATLSPANINGTSATGAITFFQNGVALGTAPVGSDGTAQLVTTTELQTGSTAVTATFNGDANFQASTAQPIPLAVTAVPSSILLTTNTGSKTTSQTGVLTAAVVPTTTSAATLASVFASGTITFTAGTTVLGTAPVAANGVAALPVTTTLPTGVNGVVATYSGDPGFTTGVSAPSQVTVTPHALVPTVKRATVPAQAVGGERIHGSVSVQIQNELSGVEAGPAVGGFAVRVFLSTDGTATGATGAAIGTAARTTVLQPGRFTRVSVPVTSVPLGVPTGTYHVVVETTDTRGNVETIDTGKTIAVAAPSITYAAAFDPATLAGLTTAKGAAVVLTVNGNGSEITTFTATVSFTTDAAGTAVVATGAGTVRPQRSLVRAGQTRRLQVNGWQTLLAALPAGQYYAVVKIVDSSGTVVSAVTASPVSA